MKLHFRKIGQGPALIIIHGVYGNGDNWHLVAKYLQEKYAVYLPDMRNHGRSDHSEAFDYDCMSEDIYELIHDEGLNSVTILGHSMGGRIAMFFAVKYESLVKELIIVDIAPVTMSTKKRATPLFQSHKDIVENLLALPIDTLKTREEADGWLAKTLPFPEIRQFLLKNLKRDSDQKFYWQINLPVIAENMEKIVVGDKVLTDPVECKTLFIKGENSSYLTMTDLDMLEMFYPNLQFEVVKGAGHWVHADKPEEFKQILTRYLRL